jgi:hypothetical protein
VSRIARIQTLSPDSYREQQDNHPIELFDHKILHQKLDYVHYNPVVAGIVEKPEDYLYSSARDYCGVPSSRESAGQAKCAKATRD